MQLIDPLRPALINCNMIYFQIEAYLLSEHSCAYY